MILLMNNRLTRTKLIYFSVFSFIIIIFLITSLFFTKQSRKGDLLTKVVKKGDLVQKVTISGTIQPFKKSLIMAPYKGYVGKLFVSLGSRVNQGTPLVTVVQSLQSAEPVFPLRSPFSGLVVQIAKTEGEYVETSSQDFILRVDDLSRLFISGFLSEIDRLKIKEGQEGVIRVSALPEELFKGIVRRVSISSKESFKESYWSNQNVEYPVYIEILEPSKAILPGMSVLMDIVIQKKENVLILGHEFIHTEKKSSLEDSFFVIQKNGKRSDIKIGLQNEEFVEILEGVNENDIVTQVDFIKEATE